MELGPAFYFSPADRPTSSSEPWMTLWMLGLEEELDALLERLNLAKYKEVMEENEVRGERERALQTEAISNLGVILEISRRGFAEVSGCVD